MNYNFIIGNKYSRRDIYKNIGISEDTRGGNWDTGYNKFREDWFIFANIGIPGRTGHNYDNEFIGDDLFWRGKTGSRIGQPSIHSMIYPTGEIYIFTRTNDKDPFVFSGCARVKEFREKSPVEILWAFSNVTQIRPETIAEEVLETEKIYEGAMKIISVNIYERNPIARRICIEHYGISCSVCDSSLERIYGDLGKGFIHVHHLKPIHEVGEEYTIDPIKDMMPVCPNCHAMLHRRNPPYSIEELKAMVFIH